MGLQETSLEIIESLLNNEPNARERAERFLAVARKLEGLPTQQELLVENPDEEWRSVLGWEGVYQVSNLGRVRQIGNGRSAVSGRICTGSLNAGYMNVAFSRPGQKLSIHRVHRLVAEAFIGPIPNGYHVHHVNGNRTDNRVANLEVVLMNDHVQATSGFHRGEQHYKARLCEAQILAIRSRYATGRVTMTALAKEYGVGYQNIEKIVHLKTWTHVGQKEAQT